MGSATTTVTRSAAPVNGVLAGTPSTTLSTTVDPATLASLTAAVAAGLPPSASINDNAVSTTTVYSSSKQNSTFAAARAEVYHDTTGKADVNPIPVGYVLDSGAVVVGNASPNGTFMKQAGGAWTMDNVTGVGVACAAYLTVQTPNSTRAKLIVDNPSMAVGSAGSGANVVPEQHWGAGYSAQSVAGIHFARAPVPDQWTIGLWNPNAGQDTAPDGTLTHVDHHIVFGPATALTLSVNTGSGAQVTGSVDVSNPASSAANLQTALVALSNVGAGKVRVRKAPYDNSLCIRWDPTLGTPSTFTVSITASSGAGTPAPAVYFYASLNAVVYWTGTNASLGGGPQNDGQPHVMRLLISHESSSAFVMWDNGTFLTVTHPAISAFCGPYVTYECFQNNNTSIDVPMTRTQIGASSLTAAIDRPVAHQADLAKMVAAAVKSNAANPQYPAFSISDSSTYTTVCTTNGVVYDIGGLMSGTVKANNLGRIKVKMEVHLRTTAACVVYVSVRVGTGAELKPTVLVDTSEGVTVSGTTYPVLISDRRSATFALSGLTPGASYTLKATVRCSVAGAASIVNDASGRSGYLELNPNTS